MLTIILRNRKGEKNHVKRWIYKRECENKWSLRRKKERKKPTRDSSEIATPSCTLFDTFRIIYMVSRVPIFLFITKWKAKINQKNLIAIFSSPLEIHFISLISDFDNWIHFGWSILSISLRMSYSFFRLKIDDIANWPIENDVSRFQI